MARQPQYPPRHIDPASRDHDSEEDDEEIDEEDEVEFDLAEVMNQMSLTERRSVYALRGVFEDYKAARARMYGEIAQLQYRTHRAAQALYDARREIVTGARDVTEEEQARLTKSKSTDAAETPAEASAEAENATAKKGVQVVSPGDAAAAKELQEAAARPDGGIPHFWLTALSNSEVFEGRITERDRDCLRALRDIRVSYINDDPSAGVHLHFDFASNDYFSNPTLTKTYHMEFNEDDGEVEVSTIEGCEIDWTSAHNKLTVVVKQKKQRNRNTKQVRVVAREEKCDSFFHFFTAPKEPGQGSDDEGNNKNKDADDDMDEDDYEQETEMDIEAGQALMEAIVPKAAYYYTGKSVEEMAQDMCKQYGVVPGTSDDDEEDESEEDDQGEPQNTKCGNSNNKNKGNAKKDQAAAAVKAKSGAPNDAAPSQQECKQQ